MNGRSVQLLLLAAALTGFAGLSHAARPAAVAEKDVDANFVSSWMGLDAGAASKLVKNGAAAAQARRDLLASAASFGEAVLPGAYPPRPPPPARRPPPPSPSPKGPTVTFTATINGTFVEAAFRGLVAAQATKAGAKGAVTITILKLSAVVGRWSVNTQVTLTSATGNDNAALALYAALIADPGAKWLDARFPGSSVSTVTTSVTVPKCASNLCKVCSPLTPKVCTECLTTSSGKSVYRTAAGECKLCVAANCSKCGATGACVTCATNFVLRTTGKCEKCDDKRCLSCPNNPKTCESCSAFNGGFALYLSKDKLCKACPMANCDKCTDALTCVTCKKDFVLDKGACKAKAKCEDANCLSCPTSPKVCSTCATGFVAKQGKCQKIVCGVANCMQCVAGQSNACRQCNSGFKLTNGNKTCSKA